MTPSRWLLLGLMIFLSASLPVQAQRRWQRLPAPRDPQFYEPRNKLEEFDGRMETLLIKGRTWVGTLRVQNGSLRVEAIDIRDTLDSSHANGVVITIVAAAEAPAPLSCLYTIASKSPRVRYRSSKLASFVTLSPALAIVSI